MSTLNMLKGKTMTEDKKDNKPKKQNDELELTREEEELLKKKLEELRKIDPFVYR